MVDHVRNDSPESLVSICHGDKCCAFLFPWVVMINRMNLISVDLLMVEVTFCLSLKYC